MYQIGLLWHFCTLSYLHYPSRLLFTKIGYYSPKEATMYQRRHLMYQSRLLRHFVSTVAHFGRSRQASIHQNRLLCTKAGPYKCTKARATVTVLHDALDITPSAHQQFSARFSKTTLTEFGFCGCQRNAFLDVAIKRKYLPRNKDLLFITKQKYQTIIF